MEQVQIRKYKLISFTDTGAVLMHRIENAMRSKYSEKSSVEESTGDITSIEELSEMQPDSNSEKKSEDVQRMPLSEWTKKVFKSGNILVFIGAVGIAVRAIAPFIRDKFEDPAVLVIDERGRFVIPILSGHVGGGVKAAKELAEIVGAEPVITTATDAWELFAVDVFAKENRLVITDREKAKRFSAELLRSGRAYYLIDEDYRDELKGLEYLLDRPELSRIEGISKPAKTKAIDGPAFIISPKNPAKSQLRGKRSVLCKDLVQYDPGSSDEKQEFSASSGPLDEQKMNYLQLIPRCIVVGMGCRKGISGDALYGFLTKRLEREGIDIRSVAAIASADKKKDEKGLIDLSERLSIPFKTYSSDELMSQEGDFSHSEFVESIVGADNVCERAAIAYGCRRLILRKTKEDGMTLALGVAYAPVAPMNG